MNNYIADYINFVIFIQSRGTLSSNVSQIKAL